MSNHLVKVAINKKILNLTLNDPEHQNTLSEDMIAELDKNLQDAAKDNSVKVIILSSTGPVFCAGHNLKDLNSKRSDIDKGKGYFEKIFKSCSNLMINIIKNPKPVIASINGIATAAGCQLVASCDLAYASTNAKFATPGVNIGLFCSTPMVALSRNVNKKPSMEMLLTGDLIESTKAKEIGLINEVCSPEQLVEKVFVIAEKISSKSMTTLKIGKEAFYKQKEMTIEEAYKYTSAVMIENMLKKDSEEGISAFIEKRTPTWEE
tara:strand:- start:248 stop:1039 length:792 start_codon:yes stop_codon:yes gene_type:complete